MRCASIQRLVWDGTIRLRTIQSGSSRHLHTVHECNTVYLQAVWQTQHLKALQMVWLTMVLANDNDANGRQQPRHWHCMDVWHLTCHFIVNNSISMDSHSGVCLLRTNVYSVCLLLVWILGIPNTCVVALSSLLTRNFAWHHCFKVSGVVLQTWKCRWGRYEQQFSQKLMPMQMQASSELQIFGPNLTFFFDLLLCFD